MPEIFSKHQTFKIIEYGNQTADIQMPDLRLYITSMIKKIRQK